MEEMVEEQRSYLAISGHVGEAQRGLDVFIIDNNS